MRIMVSVVCMMLLIASCKQPGDYKKFTNDPFLYCKTVKQLNNVVLENNFPPMIASRNYVYANIAAYEAMVAGDSRFNSLAGQITHLPPLPKQDTTNVDFHFASLLAFCKVGEAVTFPEGSMVDYVNAMKHAADSAGMPEEVMTATQKFADSVAAHILKWSKGDNYAQTRSASKYTVINEEGRWIPTPPAYTTAVEPHWMKIRTMVLDSCSQFRCVIPPAYEIKKTDVAFYKDLMEVKNIGDSLTEEQKHIADFWDDNPFKLNVQGHMMFATKKFSPPGHWMNIVGIAAQKAKADFGTTVCAYTETSIALFDGFIGCWDEKFRSNLVRPETVINKHIDQMWRPYIQTPPFPSYPSGHSVISNAAAEVMTSIFGDNLSFTDTSLLEFGIKNRQIESFRKAAEEAGISRLYGGIHYRFDIERGNEMGRSIGTYIVQRLKMRKETTAHQLNH
ncbi:MAG TPA: vanadium-dependent haloperoxidase [Chitinophagaceae bacterium]